MSYSSSIVVHRFIVPGVILGVLCGVGLFGYSQFRTEADKRAAMYRRMKQQEQEVVMLTSKVKPELQKLLWWRAVASGDQYERIGEVLGKLERNTSPEQLNREKFRKDMQTALSADVKAPMEQFTIGFRGRYGVMQTGLLALETQQPNLLLSSMNLSAKAGADGSAAPKVSAEVTFQAFTNDPQP